MAIRRAALACGVTLLVAHVGAFVPTTARAAFTAPSTGAYVPCRGVSGALRLRASAPRNADESKDGVDPLQAEVLVNDVAFRECLLVPHCLVLRSGWHFATTAYA